MPDFQKQIEEYKILSSRNVSLDERIWQTAAVFLPASVIAAGFVATREVKSTAELLSMVFFSLIGMSILLVWWRIYERWAIMQSINSHRARELEEDLGFWFNRYQHLIHEWDRNARDELEQLRESDAERYERLDDIRSRRVPGFLERVTARGWVRLLLVATLLGWSSLLIVKSFDYEPLVGWSLALVTSVAVIVVAAWAVCGLTRTKA